MTGHSESLSKTCRLCASKFDAGEDKYSVKNVWFLEFLTKNYENVPDFAAEDESVFPKFICKMCYRNFHHFNTAAEKHRKGQSRKAKNLRAEFGNF